jgi:hypothetical protein
LVEPELFTSGTIHRPWASSNDRLSIRGQLGGRQTTWVANSGLLAYELESVKLS